MAASSAAIRAGAAYVEMLLDNKQFLGGLAAAQSRFRAAGAAFKATGKAISQTGSYLATAGAAMLAPIVLATREFMRSGDQLDKMSARVGASVEFLSALGHAARIGGTDLESMEVAIRKLQRSAYDASTGTKTTADAFKTLGVAVTNADGSLKGTEQLFMETAAALSGVRNETQKAALATVLFGRSGTQLLPMLSGGKEGLIAVMEEAKRLGLVMSTEDSKAAAALTDAMERLWSSVKRIGAEVGAALAPKLQTLAEIVIGVLLPVMRWINSNAALVASLSTAAAGLLAYGLALKVVGAAMTLIVAHPIGLVLIAGAAAAAALAAAMRPVVDLSTKAADALSAGDAKRSASQGQVARLQELAEKTRLNNKEQEEARSLIAALTKSYGDLGLSLDTTTGKINGVAAAQGELNRRMRAAATSEAQTAVVELRDNLDKLQAAQKAGAGWSLWNPLTESAEEYGQRLLAEAASRAKTITAARLKLEAATQRVAALEGGKPGSLTGPDKAGGVPGADIEADATDAAAKAAIDQAHRLAEIRIGLIRDQYDRERAAIDEKYAHEIAKAKAAGQEIAGLEKLRDAEQEAARVKMERAGAEQSAAARRKEEEDRQAADDAIRAEIEASDLTDAEKQRALLDLQQQRERRQATAAGLDMDLIVRKHAAEKDALDKQQAMQAGTAAAEQKIGASGTFSAFAAARMGLGGGAQERAARAAEAALPLLRNIGERIPDAVPVFTD